ncbi:hypothetical protein [Agromyces sp. PvR057]|uniref:hypothetical protein n=1 Tax=Agromyces sp. PvR057 TaxID=3156403 RepID=UPI0033979EF9
MSAPHRTSDQTRIRAAHQSRRFDVEKAEAVYEHYREPAKREPETEAVTERGGLGLAEVRARIAASLLSPEALALSCSEHDAEPGAWCFGRPGGAHGICPGRIADARLHALRAYVNG